MKYTLFQIGVFSCKLFMRCFSTSTKFNARKWANRFINAHLGLIHIIASSRQIMFFDGFIWVPLSSHSFHSFIYAWLPSVKGSHLSMGQIDQICQAILYDPAVSLNYWPLPPDNLIQFKNSVLNLNTRALLPISSKYYFTHFLPYDVDQSMLSTNTDPFIHFPHINRWLEFVANGDNSRRIFLIYYLVLIIRGFTHPQILLNIYGPGGTGKTVYQLLATALVGLHNVGGTTLSNIETNRFETAGLIDKLLVIVADSPRYRGEVSTLKAMTGGDPIRIERKYQSSGTATFHGNIIIVGNQPLHVNDLTSGWTRRHVTMEFDKIPTERLPLISLIKDQYTGLFIPELSYFILYLLSIDTRLVLESMNPDGRSIHFPFLTESSKELISTTNSIISFITTHIEADISNSIYFNSHHGESLYPHYIKFCAKFGFNPENTKVFPNLLYSQLVALGYVVSKSRDKNGAKLTGIRMK